MFDVPSVILYNLIIVVGTAYLVGWHGWSPFTFILTLLLMYDFRSSKGEKPANDKDKGSK